MKTLILVMLLSGASVAAAQSSSGEGRRGSGGRPGTLVPSTGGSKASLPMPGAAIPASLVILLLACRRIVRS